jgi:CheY-like chemotaxis protein
MSKIKILWADDEIDSLKPQIMFLEAKGYQIVAVTNGYDAIEECREQHFDVVFLDESMPGITGLETLSSIKTINSAVPIVMITKNEAENIMESAIGAQITDYLIKPVNPHQILLTLKKIIDSQRLVSAATTSAYQQEFMKIFSQIQASSDYHDWVELYKKLIFWELELENNQADEMKEILANQKEEANNEFCKFIGKNYIDWIQGRKQAPTMSHTLFKNKIFPKLQEGVSNFVILIDNLRFDQWKVIQPIISECFRFIQEETFFSILPSSTHYSRNAIFAGMMPLDIEKNFPQFWKNDVDEGGKNLHEADFLEEQLNRNHINKKHRYLKITNNHDGNALVDNILNLTNNDLNVIVYNFVDMLSHARTEMEVLKELASDEAAYRSITRSWFIHSPLWQALRRLEDRPVNIIITTDHGTVRVQRASKVIGDRETTTNLRYKHGRNLQYNAKDVLEFRRPADAKLPTPNVSSTFIFAKEDLFFAYPNNYNYYVNYFRNTFQHGGISLEEMIIPIVQFSNK